MPSCFTQRKQPILDAPAVSRWGGREVVLATKNGKVTTSGCSVPLPRWPVLWLVTSLANCMGARLAKLFHIPKLVLIFWTVNSQQHWPDGLTAAAAAATARTTGRRISDQRQQKTKAPSWGREPRPPAFLLILTPHFAFVLPGGSLQIPPAPKILPRRALLQPCDQSRVQEGFAILFYRGPTARFATQPPTRPVQGALVALFPARRFSLSRRPLHIIQPPPVISRAQRSRQSRVQARSFITSSPSLHPPPTAGR